MSASDKIKADISLSQHLDRAQTNCLNEDDVHSLTSILTRTSTGTAEADGDGAYVESDADEQLLLNIYFTQKVRLRSLLLRTHPAHLPHAPRSVKLFINRSSLGFEDVDGEKESGAAQTIELSEEDVREGKPVTLRYVRFQSVNSVHVFVASNQGGEETTRIDFIDFLGSLNEGTRDLSKLGAEEE